MGRVPLLDDMNLDKSVRQMIDEAEQLDADCFDVMHLTLDNGNELVVVAITGEYLDPVVTVLEAVRDLREAK
ncbi:hypothetical protein NK553_14805 [Pseudomonas sp. ZM23]|uniref:Uncharacterized protein n=1 Tax=Pseudomonas triclosanedens TaxID=2961893 RepID=A0ABY6ZVU2_9PSED|nr:hypothetical protein [Pseudomonas triclosanedens]MCP8465219.1 hypothetical protein [Pseudomonas triclosanedens]MCP8470841.1 hypothetical protein [Pseudomonas triclosanedens]MCP8476590.1 hypothetical protein [Pseudomonas triclosanedens]WAI49024.1 hypothetical protein OU419_25290 [Pseudomonas triclosanedens]